MKIRWKRKDTEIEIGDIPIGISWSLFLVALLGLVMALWRLGAF